MENFITIKSNANATVLMTVPQLNLRKEWPRRGAIQRIPFDILEQAFFEPGVEAMFKGGILFIDDKETRVKLGLEEEEETNSNSLDLNDKYLSELFTKPISEYSEIINSMTYSQLETVENAIYDKKITDFHRCKVVSERMGKDVLKICLDRIAEAEADAQV